MRTRAALGIVVLVACLVLSALLLMPARQSPTDAEWYARVKSALAQGARPTAQIGGRAPLDWAVRMGDVALVRQLLARGVDPNARDAWRRAYLANASAGGNVAVVAALLEAGADTETANPDGMTPLLEAVRWGRTEVVRVLLAQGAGRAHGGAGRAEALEAAREAGRSDIVALLRAAGTDGAEPRVPSEP